MRTASHQHVGRLEGLQAWLTRVHAEIGAQGVQGAHRRPHDGPVALAARDDDRAVGGQHEDARVPVEDGDNPASLADVVQHRLGHLHVRQVPELAVVVEHVQVVRIGTARLDPDRGGGVGHAEEHLIGIADQHLVRSGEANRLDARADHGQLAGFGGRADSRRIIADPVAVGGDRAAERGPALVMITAGREVPQGLLVVLCGVGLRRHSGRRRRRFQVGHRYLRSYLHRQDLTVIGVGTERLECLEGVGTGKGRQLRDSSVLIGG